MMYWSGDWDAWAWVAMTVSMFAFWSLVGLAIWAVVRRSDPGTPADRREGAEELLRRRYAGGEIDDDEFERRLRSLQRTGGTKVG